MGFSWRLPKRASAVAFSLFPSSGSIGARDGGASSMDGFMRLPEEGNKEKAESQRRQRR